MASGLVQSHHHQSACLGGQMLGHGFVTCTGPITSGRKACVPLGEAKSCSAPEKCYSLSASWDFLPILEQW